ncbi:hypothetical protein Hanom_Chr03g00216431 [Helianthus anomalus]
MVEPYSTPSVLMALIIQATPVRSRDSDFDYTYDSHDKQGGCFNLFEGYLQSMLQSHVYVVNSFHRRSVRSFTTCYGLKPPFKILRDEAFIHHVTVNRVIPADTIISNILF